MMWFMIAGFVIANPVRKTIEVDGIEREYLVYTPSSPFSEKAAGIMVCLHGFGRTMNDFFDEYKITDVADSLNLVIVAPQALPEQSKNINAEALIISAATDNPLVLNAVWGCGLRVRANLLVLGTTLLNEELNKNVDDVAFIDRTIDEVIADYSLQTDNIFMLGTSMGGFMTYQYALEKGERLSGIISIAGSMGLNIRGLDYSKKIPVCDFHSVTDEVVPYTGSQLLSLPVFSSALTFVNVTLAKPVSDVIDYWSETNSTGNPIKEQIQYYPSANGITVEKFTYPHPEHEVIHYKINGAKHSYFFKKDNGDCMDHVEEISRFIQAHLTGITHNTPIVTEQKLSFYPNPVSDKVFFNTTNGIISVYDLTGRVVYSQSFNEGYVDLSCLNPGIYMIRVQSGKTVQTGKLVKN